MAGLNQQLLRDKNMNKINLGNTDVFPRLLIIMRLPTLSITRGVVFDRNFRNPDLVLSVAYKFLSHLADTCSN